MILQWLLFSFVLVVKANNKTEPEEIIHFDVIIIGAGVSGLSAAEELSRNGVSNIKIIEATERIGGRIVPIPNHDGFIELGANWIHGDQEDNSIFKFSQENGLLKDSINDLSDDLFEGAKFLKSTGEKFPSSSAYEALYFFDKVFEGSRTGPNITTLQEFFDKKMEDYIKVYPSSITEKEIENFEAAMYALAGVLEVEAAEDFNKIPSHLLDGLAETLFNDVNFLLKGGMKSIVDALVSKLPEESINLKERVLEIDISENDIVVTTDSKNYTANHVIVTIPLGVLKADHKELFSPNLPAEKVQAIENMGFGALSKVYLEWNEPWWTDNEAMLFAWTKEELESQKLPEEWYKSIPLVIPFNRGTKNLLWLNVVGDGSRVADTLSDEEFIKITTEVFRNFTNNENIPEPVKIYRQNWSADPSFRGTYSHPGFNSMLEDYSVLLKPLPSDDNPRLLLAGEHTHPKYSATMHGARSSGIEQAKKILNFIF